MKLSVRQHLDFLTGLKSFTPFFFFFKFILFLIKILSSLLHYIPPPSHLPKVKEAFDQLSGELLELKAALGQSQQREKQSGSLVPELTAMVKEQKSRIAELIKAKRDAVTDLKVMVENSTAVGRVPS